MSGPRLGALLGGALWSLFLFVLPISGDPLSLIPPLFLLAALVAFPLILSLHREEGSRLLRWGRFLHPLAGASAALSFLVKPGLWAGIVAAPWLLFTVVLALHALLRLKRRGRLLPLPELAVDIGLLYSLVGGIWLVAARFDLELFGFSDVIAMLTAVHFHYAGTIAAFMVGVTGRAIAGVTRRPRRMYSVAAIGILAGPALVATGWMATDAVEAISAALLAAAMTLFAFVLLAYTLQRVTSRGARLLLILASVASVAAMVLALLYALSPFLDRTLMTIPSMVTWHGLLNALFAIAGLSAWSIESEWRRRNEGRRLDETSRF